MLLNRLTAKKRKAVFFQNKIFITNPTFSSHPNFALLQNPAVSSHYHFALLQNLVASKQQSINKLLTTYIARVLVSLGANAVKIKLIFVKN